MHNLCCEIAKLIYFSVTQYCRDAAYGAARIPDNAAKIVVQRNDAAIYFSVRDRSAPGSHRRRQPTDIDSPRCNTD